MKAFVLGHKEDNIRHELFAKYEAFLEVLNSEITSDFVQFIDGSFVSKKSHPRDMDIVTFIDYKILN